MGTRHLYCIRTGPSFAVQRDRFPALIILLVLYQQGDNSRVRCGTSGIAEALPSGLLAYAVPRGLMLYQGDCCCCWACSKGCDVVLTVLHREKL
jgi:hypothetical protein